VVKVPLRQLYRTYDERYFALYKSHSQAKEGGAAPVEENFDGRGNVLKGALFKIIIPFGLLVLIGALFVVSRFFSGGVSGKSPPVPALVEQAPALPVAVPVLPKPLPSDKWRVLGYWTKGDVVMVASDDGHWLRVFHAPSDFERGSISLSVRSPDDELMTSYSGPGSAAAKAVGVAPALPRVPMDMPQ
jgi:hypothetical protein